LIDSTGQSVSLFDLTKEKITVLSFMYTACADIGGCPLAATVLQQIDQLLGTRPELAKQVALFSVSFDVERDTPERLAEIRQTLAEIYGSLGLPSQSEWQWKKVLTLNEHDLYEEAQDRATSLIRRTGLEQVVASIWPMH
jgi:cytochrome oxidase Cu insertion factor (SCO1/SenC/PrrC family)